MAVALCSDVFQYLFAPRAVVVAYDCQHIGQHVDLFFLRV